MSNRVGESQRKSPMTVTRFECYVEQHQKQYCHDLLSVTQIFQFFVFSFLTCFLCMDWTIPQPMRLEKTTRGKYLSDVRFLFHSVKAIQHMHERTVHARLQFGFNHRQGQHFFFLCPVVWFLFLFSSLFAKYLSKYMVFYYFYVICVTKNQKLFINKY